MAAWTLPSYRVEDLRHAVEAKIEDLGANFGMIYQKTSSPGSYRSSSARDSACSSGTTFGHPLLENKNTVTVFLKWSDWYAICNGHVENITV